jgi:hypothetical protein
MIRTARWWRKSLGRKVGRSTKRPPFHISSGTAIGLCCAAERYIEERRFALVDKIPFFEERLMTFAKEIWIIVPSMCALPLAESELDNRRLLHT